MWYDYDSSADVLRIKHGYDRVSNRLYREEADTSRSGPALLPMTTLIV